MNIYPVIAGNESQQMFHNANTAATFTAACLLVILGAFVLLVWASVWQETGR